MMTAAVLCWLTMLAADCTGHEILPEGVVLMAEKPTDAVVLTRPDGSKVWVNPHAVALIRGPIPGESGHTVLVFTSGGKQAVIETVDEIRDIMAKSLKDSERE